MKNIPLSIITINYNDAKGLQKTIESVACQTWKNFEYIVIDGGSVDGSQAVIENYKDSITYSVSEKDKGIYNGMNKGIKEAKGEYLLFLNSGDTLLNNTVLEVVHQSFLSDVSFLCGHLVYEQDGKTIVKEHPEKMTFSYLVSKTVYHPSTFIKRSLFEKYGLYNEENRIVSDWEFFFKALGLNGESYLKLNHAITDFDMMGISSSNQDKVQEEKSRVFGKYLPYMLNNENDIYIFEKFKETNKRFKLLKEIDKQPFFRKITTLQLTFTKTIMKIFTK